MAGHVDWWSVVIAAVGFGSLVYGLSEVGIRGEHTVAYLTLAVGVLGVGGFVWRQLVLQRVDRPLLDLRTLKHRTFTVSLALMSVAFMAMLGSMILLPLYLQDVLHLSTLMTGLLLMPGGLVMGLLGPVVGRAYDRFGAPRLVVPGAVIMATTLALFTRVGTDTSPWLLLANYVALMASLGLVFTPVFTSGLSVLPPHLYAHGSAVLGSLQQVAAAAGTAIVVSVMAGRAASATVAGAAPLDALSTGVRWGFGVGAVLALGVVAISFAVRTPSTDRATAPH